MMILNIHIGQSVIDKITKQVYKIERLNKNSVILISEKSNQKERILNSWLNDLFEIIELAL